MVTRRGLLWRQGGVYHGNKEGVIMVTRGYHGNKGGVFKC